MGGELIPVNPPSTTNSGESSGGSGGSRADARLELQAANQRWNITSEQRERAICRILERMMVENDGRALAALANALGVYDKLNLEAAGDRPNTGEITIRVVHGNTNPPAD